MKAFLILAVLFHSALAFSDHIDDLEKKLSPYFPTEVKKKAVDSGDEFLDMVFAEAYKSHMKESDRNRVNLYFKKFDVKQIDLFNLLATKVPQVSVAAEIANSLVVDQMNGKSSVLVDIGMGTGRQAIEILKLAKNSGKTLEEINVIGIEPDAESLTIAEKTLKEYGASEGLKVKFTAIVGVVEGLNDAQWSSIPKGAIFNASFALHHAKEQKLSRTDVLRRVKEREPSLLVLSEPNVHHYEENYRERFRTCYTHFLTTFRIIDSLDISSNEKAALKRNFFGREISDILSVGERNERHESTESWLQRLADAGLKPHISPRSFKKDKVSILNKDGYYSIEKDSFPLISVLHFN